MRHLVIALALLVLPVAALASPVPYSGQLTESGTPVNGNRYIAINIYAGSFGGPSLYTQAESLAVVNGIYHTMLNAPNALWDGSDRWIGVAVNGGTELSPRVRVGWVPYAISTSHVSPQLFTRPSLSKNVFGNQWVAIDSISVIATVDGFATINFNGDAFWTGSVSAPAVLMAISEGPPTDVITSFQHAPGTFILPLSPTLMTPVTAGTHVFTVWAQVLVAGQSYAISSRRFQALFIPN